jgi:hypothetical protein
MGIVRPSALAVVRLMTNSNLVGCCTGRSENFVLVAGACDAQNHPSDSNLGEKLFRIKLWIDSFPHDFHRYPQGSACEEL